MGWVVSVRPLPLYPWLRPGGPQGRSRRVRNISPLPGFDPRTVQTVATLYADWATPVPRQWDRTVKKFRNYWSQYEFLWSTQVIVCVMCWGRSRERADRRYKHTYWNVLKVACLQLLFEILGYCRLQSHGHTNRPQVQIVPSTASAVSTPHMYETCLESKDTKVLNMYNIFYLQKRHCESIACT
jgi:hypothetical protein